MEWAVVDKWEDRGSEGRTVGWGRDTRPVCLGTMVILSSRYGEGLMTSFKGEGCENVRVTLCLCCFLKLIQLKIFNMASCHTLREIAHPELHLHPYLTRWLRDPKTLLSLAALSWIIKTRTMVETGFTFTNPVSLWGQGQRCFLTAARPTANISSCFALAGSLKC